MTCSVALLLLLLQNLKDPELVEQLLARTPLKRLAQPEDVSGEGEACFMVSVL